MSFVFTDINYTCTLNLIVACVLNFQLTLCKYLCLSMAAQNMLFDQTYSMGTLITFQTCLFWEDCTSVLFDEFWFEWQMMMNDWHTMIHFIVVVVVIICVSVFCQVLVVFNVFIPVCGYRVLNNIWRPFLLNQHHQHHHNHQQHHQQHQLTYFHALFHFSAKCVWTAPEQKKAKPAAPILIKAGFPALWKNSLTDCGGT